MDWQDDTDGTIILYGLHKQSIHTNGWTTWRDLIHNRAVSAARDSCVNAHVVRKVLMNNIMERHTEYGCKDCVVDHVCKICNFGIVEPVNKENARLKLLVMGIIDNNFY